MERNLSSLIEYCEETPKYRLEEETLKNYAFLKNIFEELKAYRSMKEGVPYMIQEGKLYEIEADIYATCGRPLLVIKEE